MKAIVVGAGVIGVTVAYELNHAGFDVTVFDQAADAALGATDANGGLLTPSMSDPWNAPGIWKDLLRWIGRDDAPMLLRLSAFPRIIPWGIRFLIASRPDLVDRASRLNAELGHFSLQCLDELRSAVRLGFAHKSVGTMKIYRNSAALEAGVVKSAKIADLGVVSVRLDAEEAVRLEPALRPIRHELAGALHFPEDQSGHAPLFARALARHTADAGVTYHFSSPVSGLLVEQGRVAGVRHEGGITRGDIVVLASGHALGLLAADGGIRVPVSPVKGYSITLPVGRATPGAQAPLPAIPMLDDDLHAAITPLGDQLRIAGTAEFVGLDASIAKGRVDNLCALVRQILPEHAGTLLTGDLGARAGFRPMSADGLPIFGAGKVKGVYLAGGHGALGWTQSLGTARLLRQMILGQATAMPVAAFSPERFSR
ncbi:FAD-dependent oxidoreductase [Pseudokordiimonas caeni]|uniref:FAD-dependent oxidoreductase n=1 Tax=Pseudokordiimonas caeni TaxID=2997908 RepID=UPI0028112E2F|nr:FAD-dependent oxidoreductase [Pseudokordiimonas caeni]